MSTDLVITGATLLTSAGSSFVDVSLADGRIESVQPHGEITGTGRVLDADGAIISPGMIDLHIHGAFGAVFDDCDATAFADVTAGLAQRGVTTIQTSIVSQPIERMAERIATLTPLLGPQLSRSTAVGIHLEGPFLSPIQAGAHEPSALREPSDDDLKLIHDHQDAISMITVAAELPRMEELITLCRESSVVTALGHSDGELDDFDRARAAGASHITHLWSCQSMVRRHGPWRVPGMLESALASDLSAEIIADGKHLPPTLLEIARRCLADRLVVVSDATPGAGMPAGYRYQLGTVQCVVADGVGMIEGQDAFAGSTTLLDDMVRHLVRDLGWPMHQVLPMVTSTPASVLERPDLGVVKPGARADLLLWDADLSIREVIIGGQRLG